MSDGVSDGVTDRPGADAFALPELTRALRAFGSGRARPGSDHDRYFAPLVGPLRELRERHARATAAPAAGEPWRAADAVDAARVGAQVRATLAALAAERFPSAAPDRRALEAELLDEAEELLTALDALDTAAVVLRHASDADRSEAWHRWARTLASAFSAADRSWTRSLPALAEAPAPKAGRPGARPKP